MRILSAWFTSGAEFLSFYDETMAQGALYYPTAAELSVGELVLVEIRFKELPNRMLLRANVHMIDLQRNGVWLTFMPEDRDTLAFIIDVARGDITVETKIQRKHRRYPVEVPVDWKASGSNHVYVSWTDDVSAGGAFVRTLSPPPVGTQVALVLTPAGSPPFTLSGKVTWISQEPGNEGMGVRFEETTSETARALRETLRKMDEAGEITIAVPPASGSRQ